MLLFGMSYICLQIFQLIGISHTHFLSYNPEFTLLDRNLSEKVEYSNAHSFEYYTDLEDEWEFLYLDDLNPVEELLAMLPASPYECDVMYYANTINREIKLKRIYILKEEYEQYINHFII